MSLAISWNFQEEFENNPDKWENKGRQILKDSCTHKTQEKETDKDNRETNMCYSGWCDECDISEDSAHPMMMFLYPLEIKPKDEDILRVVKNTNCSVMYNTETDKYFLVLCGGGMDLSQDIALSYVWLEKWIPEELLRRVAKQPCLSLSEKNWKELKKEVIEQAENYAQRFKQIKKDWKETTIKKDKV